MENKAIIGEITVHNGNATLRNACVNTTCYWHTAHWHGLYESGCYMLVDAHKCVENSGYLSIDDAMKMAGEREARKEHNRRKRKPEGRE